MRNWPVSPRGFKHSSLTQRFVSTVRICLLANHQLSLVSPSPIVIVALAGREVMIYACDVAVICTILMSKSFCWSFNYLDEMRDHWNSCISQRRDHGLDCRAESVWMIE